jgi:hypothetical protein
MTLSKDENMVVSLSFQGSAGKDFANPKQPDAFENLGQSGRIDGVPTRMLRDAKSKTLAKPSQLLGPRRTENSGKSGKL